MRIVRPVFSVFRLAAIAALLLVGAAAQADGQLPGDKIESDPYPLENCVVMQGPLSKGAYSVDVGEREIRVCCEECVERVRSNPEHWLQVVDDRIKEEQREVYPLETCVVDGVKLDDGNRLEIVFGNRLFRVCCDDCRKKLEEDPAKYFALVNRAAVAKQKPGYPLTKCVVSGKPLGKHAIDYVVGNQLVRLADAEQIKIFNQNPGEYLAQVREAWRKKPRK